MNYLFTFLLLFVLSVSGVHSQYYTSAIEYYNKGKYEKAIAEFEKVIPFYEDSLGELDPTVLPDIRYYLGVSYYFIGDLTSSCQVLEDNVKKCDNSYAVFSEPGLNSLNDLCTIYGELDRMNDVLRCRGLIVKGWRTVTNTNKYELAMALNTLGVDQSSLGKAEEAIKSYTESLELLDNCDSLLELDIPTVYSNRALSYFDLNEYEKSQEDYQIAKSLVIPIYPDTYDQYIRSYRDIAAEMTALGEYQKAVHSLGIEISTVRSLYSSRDTSLIDAYIELSSIYSYLGDIKSTETCFDSAAVIIGQNYSVESFDRALRDYNLGLNYQAIQAHKKSIEHFKKSMNFYDNYKDEYQNGYLSSLNGMMSGLIASNRVEEAHRLSEIKLAYFDQEFNNKEDFDLYLVAVLEKSRIERKLNNPQMAIETIGDAKRKTVKYLNKGANYLSLLDELVLCYASQSMFTKALKYNAEKLELIEAKKGKELDYYIAYNEKGLLCYEAGNFILALDYFEASNTFLCSIDYHNCVNSLNNIALAQTELGNVKDAEATYLKVIGIHEKNDPKSEDYIIALSNIARLYLDVNKITESTQYYQKTLDLSEEVTGEVSKLYLNAKQGVANCYLRNGKWEDAFVLLKECIGLITTLYNSNDSQAIQMMGNIAHTLCVAQQFEVAIPILEKIYERQTEQLGSKSSNTLLTMTNLALAYLSDNQLEKSKRLNVKILSILDSDVSNNLKILSEGESIAYLNRLRLNYSSPFSYLQDNYLNDSEIIELTLNTTINNKGRLLKSNSALKQQIINSNDKRLIKEYENWTQLIQRIIFLEANGGLESEIEKLKSQTKNIEKDLMTSSSLFAKSIDKQYGWKEVQRKLELDQFVLEFVDFKQSKTFLGDTVSYGVYLFDKSSKSPIYIPLFNERQLQSVLGSYGGNNLNYINAVYGQNKTKTELFELIWKKIDELIPPNSKVIISPSGLLHKVSFAGLCDGEKYLSEKYDLSYVTSLTAYGSDIKSNIANINPLLVGGIDYDAGVSDNDDHIWNYLNGTKMETDEISILFTESNVSSAILTADKVTELDLFKEMRKVNIAHIATHGFFYPLPEKAQLIMEEEELVGDVNFRGGNRGTGYNFYVSNQNALMRSGLALSGANNIWNSDSLDIEQDGVLTAQDIILQDFSNLDLVVLSACETGLGDIQGSEGVFGLQRSLKIAGVDQMIMSLWQVPDKETKEFMVFFYTELIATKNIEIAFKAAQKEMSQKYDPYYWAAFVLL